VGVEKIRPAEEVEYGPGGGVEVIEGGRSPRGDGLELVPVNPSPGAVERGGWLARPGKSQDSSEVSRTGRPARKRASLSGVGAPRAVPEKARRKRRAFIREKMVAAREAGSTRRHCLPRR